MDYNVAKAEACFTRGAGGREVERLREIGGVKHAVIFEPVSERLVTHLLRTLCPVTGQPDWGSVLIEYTGAPIDRTGLLRYIVSLRREVGFHEVAIERVFLALRTRCAPTELTVTGRFLRRGGIDINPVRSTSTPTSSTMCRVPGQ